MSLKSTSADAFKYGFSYVTQYWSSSIVMRGIGALICILGTMVLVVDGFVEEFLVALMFWVIGLVLFFRG